MWRIFSFLIILGLLLATSVYAETRPVSIVDYLEINKKPSDYESRKKIFNSLYPSELYKGTAEQNTKLLVALMSKDKILLIPFPSDKIGNCKNFYNNPEISKLLSKAFAKNVVKACVVTGFQDPQNKIRKELQVLYLAGKPGNGKYYTAQEHKEIHDKAYKAAGCTQNSANILGWIVMDAFDWSKETIDLSIRYFGKCTIPK